MADERKYRFRWELLGDPQGGRPNLGPMVNLESYRLMQYTFRDVLERRFGSDDADTIFREAGHLAGTEFYRNVLGTPPDFPAFVRDVQRALADRGIGVLRIEEADLETGVLVLTLGEDLDCSGLPDVATEFCAFDEGFIAALLESFTGRPFRVREVDFWCTGDRTCRFRAEAATPAAGA